MDVVDDMRNLAALIDDEGDRSAMPASDFATLISPPPPYRAIRLGDLSPLSAAGGSSAYTW
jgi:hypothetical protein